MQKDGIYFAAFHDGVPNRYPCWRYHKDLTPLIVNNKAEDDAARAKGYDEIEPPPTMANPQLINWYWDFEDLSPKQMCVFAKEEFGVDFPVAAGEEQLFAAILHLSRMAPKNRGRIVLMAHTIKLNYEETLQTIRNIANKGFEEKQTEVFYA